MKHSTRTPTKAERQRMERLALLGCIACRLVPAHNSGRPAEVHHLLSGNRRLGHMHTVPLCRWHHRGEPDTGIHTSVMRGLYGPSLAFHGKAFHEAYGSDADLLNYTNQLLL